MTLPNETELSFGRYLQSCRKMNNLGLDDIAHDLKVGTSVLTTIENEDFSRMPDEVYAKGFLRGYSKIVNADEGRVIQNYLQRLQQFNQSVQSDFKLARENDLLWKKLTLSLVVMFLVMFLTIFVLARPEDQTLEKNNQKVTPADSRILTHNEAVDFKNNNESASSSEPATKTIPAAETIRLSIITIEQTWMKIIIDNEKTREYTLRAGDHLEFEALRGYNLLIGNAAGIKLFANKIPIDIPGEKDKVVNINIP